MSRISEERIERYRALADRKLFELKDKKLRAFFERAVAEGVDLVSNNFNTLGMFRAPHRKNLEDVDLAMIGIPLDLGVPNPRPGTRKGPEAVRYWSLDRNMSHYFTKINPFDMCSIIDWGDVEFEHVGYNLDDCLEEIYNAFKEFVSRDIVTLSVGGEHTCTYPILRALARDGERPLALVHLDAHFDTATNFGGARISDASLFQVATTEGLIDSEKTIQIGIRGRGAVRADFSQESGMRVVYAEEFQSRGVDAIIEEIKSVVGNSEVYLTVDTDVLDCMCMPGTTLPEPFGLTGREVRDIIRGLRPLDIVGADLMELSPIYDPTGMSACLASGITFELLCLLAETRARRTRKTNLTHW